MGKGADELADNDKTAAEQGDITTTYQVRQGANKGTDGGRGQQVGSDEPDPAIDTAEVSIDNRREAAPEVNGDLGTRPQKRHAHEGHKASARHWLRGKVSALFARLLQREEGLTGALTSCRRALAWSPSASISMGSMSGIWLDS